MLRLMLRLQHGTTLEQFWHNFGPSSGSKANFKSATKLAGSEKFRKFGFEASHKSREDAEKRAGVQNFTAHASARLRARSNANRPRSFPLPVSTAGPNFNRKRAWKTAAEEISETAPTQVFDRPRVKESLKQFPTHRQMWATNRAFSPA